MHPITLRRASVDDAGAAGTICHDAFRTISEKHAFPPDFPSPDVATGLLGWLLAHPGFFGVVAEQAGRLVGSNFLDERDPVAGVGPITVDPTVQDTQIGRRLMEAVLDRADERGSGASGCARPPTITAPWRSTPSWASTRGSRCRRSKGRRSAPRFRARLCVPPGRRMSLNVAGWGSACSGRRAPAI